MLAIYRGMRIAICVSINPVHSFLVKMISKLTLSPDMPRRTYSCLKGFFLAIYHSNIHQLAQFIWFLFVFLTTIPLSYGNKSFHLS